MAKLYAANDLLRNVTRGCRHDERTSLPTKAEVRRTEICGCCCLARTLKHGDRRPQARSLCAHAPGHCDFRGSSGTEYTRDASCDTILNTFRVPLHRPTGRRQDLPRLPVPL